MHVDLTDLRLFAAIVEAGSITGGAARSGLALAAASARVRGMEVALGAPLLERGRRGVRPTPAGLALAHQARLVLAQMEILRGELRRHARGGPRGHVRLLANTAAVEEHLPEVLGGWLAGHPGVDVELEERPSHEIAAAVAQGHAAAGVLALRGTIEALEVHPFCTDRLVLAVPRGHPLDSAGPVAFARALEEDLVGLAEDGALARLLARQAARLGRQPTVRLRLRGFEPVCRLVALGVGVAVLPELAVRRCQRSLPLGLVPLSDGWAVRRLAVCVRRLAELPHHARRLVEHLIATGKASG